MAPHVDDSVSVTAAAGLLEPVSGFIAKRGLATFLVVVLLAFVLVVLDRRLEAQTTATAAVKHAIEEHAVDARVNVQLLYLVCLNTAGAQPARDACDAVAKAR